MVHFYKIIGTIKLLYNHLFPSLMKIKIIIVLYNSSFEQATTLSSLNKFKSTSEISISIWNNGPNSLLSQIEQSEMLNELREHGYQIEFNEDLSNAPLSIIYNKIIDNNLDYERFIILDHDTQLTESYFTTVTRLSNKIDLILPHIEDEYTHKLVAPTDKGKIVIEDGPINLDKPGSVSSGLALNHRLALLVKKYYKNTIFDENFALYGIDSTFLMRIRKIAKKEKIQAICQGYLRHSLSLSLNENSEIKSFRKAELSYDITLTLRHYPSFGKLKTFMRDFRKIRQGKSQLTSKNILYCLWTGKHPRCIEYEKHHS